MIKEKKKRRFHKDDDKVSDKIKIVIKTQYSQQNAWISNQNSMLFCGSCTYNVG